MEGNGLTLEVTGRRSGKAAEGTCKRSLQAVRVDRKVRPHSLHFL